MRSKAWLALAFLGLAAACGGPGYDREPRSHGGRAPAATPPPPASDLVPAGRPAPSASVAPPAGAASPPSPAPAPAGAPPFPPAAFTPPFERTAKSGDGTWRDLATPASIGARGDAKPWVVTTTVHPDPIQGHVEVAIVAIDTSRLELELVAGTEEPENDAIGREKRPGIVAPEHLAQLVIATNGGYKARHGRHGMRVGAEVFVPPKPESCTIARRADGRIFVGAWSKIAAEEATTRWIRQGPACLLEGGVPHPDLSSEYGRKKWGAAEDGKKDIRRSAYALGPGGTLYFAIGEWTAADRLTTALRAAGATDAAQMDINWSFTRFVLYGRDGSGGPVASSPILDKLKFGPREYWQKPSERDFFYFHAK